MHSCRVLGTVYHILEFEGGIFNCICADSFCELIWELRVQALKKKKKKSASSQSGNLCKAQTSSWYMGLWLELCFYDPLPHHLLAAQPEAQAKYHYHRMRCFRANGADTEPWGQLSHIVASTAGPARLFTSFLGVIVLTSNSGNSVHSSPSARRH